jgi:hypothetical protein
MSEQFPLIPSPSDDEARQFAAASLNQDFHDALVYDMAAESRAREVDLLLEKVPGVPNGWLKQRRSMGELRNPFKPAFRNVSAGMAMEAAALKDARFQGLIAYLQKDAGFSPPAPDYARQAELAKLEATKQKMLAEIAANKANPRPTMAELQIPMRGFGPSQMHRTA